MKRSKLQKVQPAEASAENEENELSGYIGLEMKKQALALARRILQRPKLTGKVFEDCFNAVERFARSPRQWRELLEAAYERLDGDNCENARFRMMVFFDSHMPLDIDELKGRLYMKKNLVGHTQAAVEMNGVLLSLLADRDLGFNGRDLKPKFDGQSFGVDIKKESSSGFEYLKGFSSDRFIWFGYENEGTNNQNRISIWICGLQDQNKRKKLEVELEPLVQSIQNAEIVEDDSGGIIIYGSAEKNENQHWSGDLEWFKDVLTKLKHFGGKQK